MEQRVKLVAAAVVLLGGVGLAMLFHRGLGKQGEQATSSQPPVLQQGERLSEGNGQSPSSILRNGTPSLPLPPPRPTLLSPAEPTLSPPGLPLSYPGPTKAEELATIPQQAQFAEDANVEQPATHRIVDGDSLPAIAVKYLGDADRAMEIYELNQELLPSPNLLPIGTEIRLPPRRRAAVGPNYMPRRPLVPLHRNHKRSASRPRSVRIVEAH